VPDERLLSLMLISVLWLYAYSVIAMAQVRAAQAAESSRTMDETLTRITPRSQTERDSAAVSESPASPKLWTVFKQDWRGVLLWIGLTVVGAVAGVYMVAALAERTLTRPPFLGMAGVGAAIGLLQWLYLRRRARVSSLWVLWTALVVLAGVLLAWSAALILAWLSKSSGGQQEVRLLALGGILISLGATVIGRRLLEPARGLVRETLVAASPMLAAAVITTYARSDGVLVFALFTTTVLWLGIYATTVMAQVRAARAARGAPARTAPR
jgi:hypothetical protein